jgi:quercetin dioxygenase-like cupin family protein
MAQEHRAFAHAPKEGKAFWFLGSLVILMLNSEQTENAFALQELTQPAGTEPPPHIHHKQDELFHILEGAATFTCGDQTWSASTGDYVFLPRGIVHTFKVAGTTPVKMEVITSPGGPSGFEHFVEEMGELAKTLTPPPPGPPDLQKLVTLAAKYDIELMIPTQE